MTKARIIHLCLGLSVCCLTSQSLNETLVNPGENISISCDNDTEQVYWYLQRSGGPPAPILRSFGGASAGAFYYGTGLRRKYSLQAGNRLFIHNFTTEDCATYYCAGLRNGVFGFFNGTALNVTDMVTGHQNLTSDAQMEQRCGFFRNSVIIAAFVLNFTLIVIILVLTRKLCTALNCKRFQKVEAPEEDTTYCVMQVSEKQNAYNEVRLPTA